MDASIYTERRAKVSKPAKTPNKEARQQKYLDKLQKETARAAVRLYPIIYRKGKVKGKLVIMLSEATRDRLAHDHTALSRAERTLELHKAFYEYLDSEGLVNQRVIKSEVDRLAAIKEIVDAALESGDIEFTTKVSRLIIELSREQMRIQQVAATTHETRLEEQRTSRRENVPALS